MYVLEFDDVFSVVGCCQQECSPLLTRAGKRNDKAMLTFSVLLSARPQPFSAVPKGPWVGPKGIPSIAMAVRSPESYCVQCDLQGEVLKLQMSVILKSKPP